MAAFHSHPLVLIKEHIKGPLIKASPATLMLMVCHGDEAYQRSGRGVPDTVVVHPDNESILRGALAKRKDRSITVLTSPDVPINELWITAAEENTQ